MNSVIVCSSFRVATASADSGRRFDDGGPILLAAKIDDQPGKVQTVRDPALIRSRFIKGLGTGRGGALDA
jgi:hypothetical protein